MHIAQHTKTYLAQMDADNKKNGTKTITNNFNQNQLENLFQRVKKTKQDI